MNEVLTQQEAAFFLRCSVGKVYQLRKQKQLRFIPGRPVKILKSELDAYLEREQTARCNQNTYLSPATGKPALKRIPETGAGKSDGPSLVSAAQAAHGREHIRAAQRIGLLQRLSGTRG